MKSLQFSSNNIITDIIYIKFGVAIDVIERLKIIKLIDLVDAFEHKVKFIFVFWKG